MTTAEQTDTVDADTDAVACPYCLVPAGAGCRTANRRAVPGGIHKARTLAAADARAIARAGRSAKGLAPSPPGGAVGRPAG